MGRCAPPAGLDACDALMAVFGLRRVKAHFPDCDCRECTDPRTRTVVDYAHVPIATKTRTGALLP